MNSFPRQILGCDSTCWSVHAVVGDCCCRTAQGGAQHQIPAFVGQRRICLSGPDGRHSTVDNFPRQSFVCDSTCWLAHAVDADCCCRNAQGGAPHRIHAFVGRDPDDKLKVLARELAALRLVAVYSPLSTFPTPRQFGWWDSGYSSSVWRPVEGEIWLSGQWWVEFAYAVENS